MSQVDDAQIEKYSIQVRQKVSEERNQWKKDHWDSLTKEEKASFPAKVLNTFSLSVLDHGFVRFVGMGTKQTEEVIPQSARISYDGDELEHTEKEDANLIDRLLRNVHTSPLEQINFSFQIKMPIFVMRQFVRHRTARLNELSGRYSVLDDDFYVPEIENIKIQSKTDKQGREENDNSLSEDLREKIRQGFIEEDKFAYEKYKERIDLGLSREIARINLPLSIYTRIHWNIDLHNLFHLLSLRLDSHAQWEIREYAAAIYAFVKEMAPVTCKSFENHILKSLKFSHQEITFLKPFLERLSKDFDQEWIQEQLLLVFNHDVKAIDRFRTKLVEGRQT